MLGVVSEKVIVFNILLLLGSKYSWLFLFGRAVKDAGENARASEQDQQVKE